jgi:hypothetical protein
MLTLEPEGGPGCGAFIERSELDTTEEGRSEKKAL